MLVSTSIAIGHSFKMSEHATDLQGVALGKVLEPIACNVNTVLNIQPVQNLIIFQQAEYNTSFKPLDRGV